MKTTLRIVKDNLKKERKHLIELEKNMLLG